VTSPFVDVVIAAEATLKMHEVEAVLDSDKFALVVIPLMAGVDRVNQSNAEQILKTFEMPSSMGIVGGRPKHSLYFFAAQLDTLFFFDPHIVLSAYVSAETLGTLPQGGLSSIPVVDLDPCMLMCFCIKSREELSNFEETLTKVVFPLGEFPLFSLQRKKAAKLGANLVSAAGAPIAEDPDDLDIDDDMAFDDDDDANSEADAQRQSAASASPPAAKPAGVSFAGTVAPVAAVVERPANRPRCAGSIARPPSEHRANADGKNGEDEFMDDL
jgi:hypothetical protein